MRLRVIGVGSPQGDDAIGLLVARRLLAEGMEDDVDVVLRERPGLGLLEDLRAADAAVLVDALRGGGEPGRVRALEAYEIAREVRVSSHGLGVGAALALAEALGGRRPPLRVVGIEIAGVEGTGLSAPLEDALAAACTGVRRALAELRAELAAAVRD